jgi:hypothetical protein
MSDNPREGLAVSYREKVIAQCAGSWVAVMQSVSSRGPTDPCPESDCGSCRHSMSRWILPRMHAGRWQWSIATEALEIPWYRNKPLGRGTALRSLRREMPQGIRLGSGHVDWRTPTDAEQRGWPTLAIRRATYGFEYRRSPDPRLPGLDRAFRLAWACPRGPVVFRPTLDEGAGAVGGRGRLHLTAGAQLLHHEAARAGDRAGGRRPPYWSRCGALQHLRRGAASYCLA